MKAPCEHLEWDSAFFGVRIARTTSQRIDEAERSAILAWCTAEKVDCLYLLADASDARTSALVDGFTLTDVRVRFDLQLAGDLGVAVAPDVRLFLDSDLAELSGIAAASHHDSRFYFDPQFPPSKCDELYRTWIRRSVEGWADAVFVAELNGSPAGYVSCHVSGVEGSIGLIAVRPEARGKGLGRQLVRKATRYLADRNLERAIVVTQGRNIASQRLYQSCGFRTEAVGLWYHRWFNRGQAL